MDFYTIARTMNGQVQVIGYDATSDEPDSNVWENLETALRYTDCAWTSSDLEELEEMIGQCSYLNPEFSYEVIEWNHF